MVDIYLKVGFCASMDYVNINRAVELLSQEELVIIPTETVYGLAGDATSIFAVEKIYTYKNRPADNPLICHFYSIEQIQEYVKNIPQPLFKLFQRFSPGPLTILLEPNDKRLNPATRGQDMVACRIPDNNYSLELIKKFDKPLAAPSANPSTMPSSTTTQMAYNYFQNFPGGILKSQPSRIGLESTILKFKNNSIQILREGSIGASEIQFVLPNIKVEKVTKHKSPTPGSFYKHYSPKTPIFDLKDINDLEPSKHHLVLTTQESLPNSPKNIQTIYLANSNDEVTISHNLYSKLIKVDDFAYKKAYIYLRGLQYSSSIGQALKNKLSKIIQEKHSSKN